MFTQIAPVITPVIVMLPLVAYTRHEGGGRAPEPRRAAPASATPTGVPTRAPSRSETETRDETRAAGIKVSSTAFKMGHTIPAVYTCDGVNASPPLAWRDVPSKAASLVLLVEDPDAPHGLFVHWVLYDLPPNTMVLPEHMPTDDTLSAFGGARQGKNGANRIGYMGPCPPPGPAHRYFFRVYALDRVLGLAAGATRDEVRKAMRGHVLMEGELMGRYGRT